MDIKKGEKTNSQGYILVQSLTLARIPLAVIFLVIMSLRLKSVLSFVISLLLLVLIEVTDAVDGRIARRFGLVSEYGAILDPFADSISRLIIYATLASQNLVLLLVPLSMALRDITVAYARILLAQKKRSVSARISGKIKAVVQATGAFLALSGPLYWNQIGSWSLYALSWFIMIATLLSAFEYIIDALHALRERG